MIIPVLYWIDLETLLRKLTNFHNVKMDLGNKSVDELDRLLVKTAKSVVK